MSRTSNAPRFVSLTGFSTPEEVRAVADIGREYSLPLAMGVLVSDKSFAGIPNKYPHRYPAIEVIPTLWDDDFLNVLHYCTDDPALPIVEEVVDTCGVGEYMGVQLNVPWPDPAKVAWLQEQVLGVVLQLGGRNLADTGGLTPAFRRRVREYADLKSNTYWLLDMSGGKGMLLDINHTRELLDLLDEESHPGQGVIVAGGLDPYNLGLLEPLRRERYKFSVDAESGLRDSVDRLDTERCIAFAMAGWELVK